MSEIRTIKKYPFDKVKVTPSQEKEATKSLTKKPKSYSSKNDYCSTCGEPIKYLKTKCDMCENRWPSRW